MVRGTGPIVNVLSEAAYGKDTSQVSLLFNAFFTAAAGDPKHQGAIARLFSVQGGAQQDRFKGGSQLIARRVAASLGKRVRLNSPVRSITQTRKGVKVVADGVSVDAKQVIVAVPPTV